MSIQQGLLLKRVSERGESRTQGAGDRDGVRDRVRKMETRDRRTETGRVTEGESLTETKQREIHMDGRMCVR